MLGLAKVYYIDFDKPFSLDTEDQLMNLHWIAHSHECVLKCAMSFEAVMCKGLQQCITLFRIWLIHYIYIETGIIWALEVSIVQICTILRFISCQSCWEVLLTFPILRWISWRSRRSQHPTQYINPISTYDTNSVN